MMANDLATEDTVSPAPSTENHTGKDNPLNFPFRNLALSSSPARPAVATTTMAAMIEYINEMQAKNIIT